MKKEAVPINEMTETAKKNPDASSGFEILVEITHYFLKIALCAAHFVIDTTLPHSDGTLDIVAGIVIGLDNLKLLL